MKGNEFKKHESLKIKKHERYEDKENKSLKINEHERCRCKCQVLKGIYAKL